MVKASILRAADTGIDPRFPWSDRLGGQVVKASASRAAHSGFYSRLCCGDFSGSSHTSDLKIGASLQWIPYQTRDVIVSALGLKGLVSIYCDLM